MANVEPQTPRRTDSWDPQDDQLLTKLVLDAIREGRTQLEAFQKAAEHLQRTPGACGFRWNGRLRRTYRNELEDAKRERKTKVKTPTQTRTLPLRVDSSIVMKDAVEFLKGISREYQELRDRIQTLTNERDRLQARVEELEQNSKTVNLSSTPEQIQQDAQLLAQIAIRARKLLGEQK